MFTPTRAIVLNSIRYSEADLVARCYTQSDGLKSYMLKNILKTRKGKIKAAMFQPFSQLEIIARHKNKGTLEYIKEAKIIAVNPKIREDIQKSSMAIFLCEVIKNAVQEEEQNEPLFFFLEEGVEWLENHEKTANFHLFFLVKFTKYLGIYPDNSAGNMPFFNLRKGHFEAVESDQYSISGSNCEILKKLLSVSKEQLAELRLNQEKRTDFLAFMISYYQYQLPGFREPKSLEVLAQLFT